MLDWPTTGPWIGVGLSRVEQAKLRARIRDLIASGVLPNESLVIQRSGQPVRGGSTSGCMHDLRRTGSNRQLLLD